MTNYLVMTINSLCLIEDTIILTKEGPKEIKDLKRGDLILTKNGYVPLAKNLLMPNDNNKYKYIRVPEKRFGSVPSRDLYISPAHPFSLGFDGMKVRDGKVSCPGRSLIISAKELFSNVWGVEEVELEDKPYYNLIFDQEEEFSANGMIILSHHPCAEGYQLPRDEFISKVNENGVNTKNVKWVDFIKEKIDSETMEDFVERRLSFNRFNWLQYVNNYHDLKTKLKTEKEAVEHWNKNGKKEGRTSLTRFETSLLETTR
jgi:hypothetical protein